MALEFCNRMKTETGIRFYYSETSALTGQNIQETFDFLAYKLLEANNIKDIVLPVKTDGIIDLDDYEEKTSEPPKGPVIIENKSTPVESVSPEEFKILQDRVQVIEDRLNTIQAIIKKIVEKIQEEEE